MPQVLTLDKKFIFAALASALAVSLIYGLPHFLIKNQLAGQGKIYSPITVFSDGDEAQIYAPFIKEAEEGKIFLGDPALKEHDKNFSLMPLSGPLFLGLSARLVGMGNIWILSDFLFPALIFLIFFILIYEIVGMAHISLVLAGIFIFAREVASLIPFSTFQQFKSFAVYFKPYLSGAVENRLPFDRLLAPEWTFIPLGIFFISWFISLKKRTVFSSVVTGIFSGFLFYSYPYDWMSVFLILGANLIFLFLSRDYRGAKLALITIISGFIVSLPYWIYFLEISRLPQYKELINRTGLEVGRTFRFFLTPHYVLWLGSSLWLFVKNKKNPMALGASAIFVASFVAMNMLMVIGYVPQPDHFFRYPLAFGLFFAYVILVKELLSRYYSFFTPYKRYFLTIAVVALIMVFTRGVQLQKAYADQNSWRYALEKPISESFLWLNEKTKEDSIVLSPSVVTNTHLLIFTKAKVFVPPTGVVTTASE